MPIHMPVVLHVHVVIGTVLLRLLLQVRRAVAAALPVTTLVILTVCLALVLVRRQEVAVLRLPCRQLAALQRLRGLCRHNILSEMS